MLSGRLTYSVDTFLGGTSGSVPIGKMTFDLADDSSAAFHSVLAAALARRPGICAGRPAVVRRPIHPIRVAERIHRRLRLRLIMPYRQLVTIPLSTGFTGTTWHLSVAYVPRLHEAGKLSDYDLDWAQWPAIAAALSVNIFVNNAPNPINPARITTVSPTPSLDVWRHCSGRLPSRTNPSRLPLHRPASTRLP